MANSFLFGGPGRTGGISIEQADERLLPVRIQLGVESVELSAALGRRLVDRVVADRPVPSFDRVCMDGYALASSAFAAGQESFEVLGQARAGQPVQTLEDASGCLEVMTGAVLPLGCDAVVAVEKVERLDQRVRLNVPSLASGANIHRRGRDRDAGDVVLPAGSVLGPGEIAALASVGNAWPRVVSLPRVVLVSSGDELVEPAAVPLAHQVRQSNVWGMAASLQRSGFGFPEILHIPDDRDALCQILASLLARTDVLILSGGVSMGRWDLIPSVLESLGVVKILHGVAQQPGMPLWMGLSAQGGLVAGLPGNPVSAMTCLVRHVVPVIERSTGAFGGRKLVELGVGFGRSTTKTRLVPVRFDEGAFPPRVVAAALDGSGDWAALVGSDGIVQIDAGDAAVALGERAIFFPW